MCAFDTRPGRRLAVRGYLRRQPRILLSECAVLLALFGIVAEAQQSPRSPAPLVDANTANLPAHRIGNDDLIAISVYASPELTRTLRVGADGFIRGLPDGYDEEIEERGGRLSIGQRQLVAFARALLANPHLLILDEATSSVDIPTEARIEQALDTLLQHRTSFVVAHRLSTIRRADLIIVLEHGEVIETGTHEQLIALRGRYFALYDDWV